MAETPTSTKWTEIMKKVQIKKTEKFIFKEKVTIISYHLKLEIFLESWLKFAHAI